MWRVCGWCLWWMVVAAGCYTPQELQRMSAEQPDPRQPQIERLWEAATTVAREERWPLEAMRREDLIVLTGWMEVGPELQRQVRVLVVATPSAVGVNVRVQYQQRDARLPPEEQWALTTDPELKLRARGEEAALTERIRRVWEGLP